MGDILIAIFFIGFIGLVIGVIALISYWGHQEGGLEIENQQVILPEKFINLMGNMSYNVAETAALNKDVVPLDTMEILNKEEAVGFKSLWLNILMSVGTSAVFGGLAYANKWSTADVLIPLWFQGLGAGLLVLFYLFKIKIADVIGNTILWGLKGFLMFFFLLHFGGFYTGFFSFIALTSPGGVDSLISVSWGLFAVVSLFLLGSRVFLVYQRNMKDIVVSTVAEMLSAAFILQKDAYSKLSTFHFTLLGGLIITTFMNNGVTDLYSDVSPIVFIGVSAIIDVILLMRAAYLKIGK